jgi:single-strand DNA-binding protein
MGRLTAEPSLNKTPSGVSVANFNLAVDRGYGDNKQTDFFPIVAWKGTAETIAKHVGKGQQVLVSGYIQTRSWTDNEGSKRSVTEVVATEFAFCESKTSTTIIASDNGKTSNYGSFTASEEDLPF